MKAELKLKPDQEKLWGPFETAVRDSAKDREENMQKMMEMRKPNEQASPSIFWTLSQATCLRPPRT